MANEFKVKNGIITPTLQSTIAAGTSPLTVASNTLVSNLNADLLDGNHASAFYLATNPSGYTTNTGTVTSVIAGSYLTGGTITTSGTLAVDATSANTANKVVARDASGNFSAGTITAALSGNATTATTLQTSRTINGVSFNGSANITPPNDWVHSNRDFPNGTLIETSIDYSVTNGDPWVLEIRGNSYGSLVPFEIQYQGYIYSDTVINHGGYSVGTSLSSLVLFNYNGKLCFWFPNQSYWHGYYVKVYTAYSGYPTNRVTAITNVAKPGAVTKEVALSANIRQALHSSNYNSYAPTLTGTGASGTWGISITGNATTASSTPYPVFSGDAAAKDNITTRTETGFYETSTGTTAEGWPSNSGTWQHLISCTHSNDNNYYAMQLASTFFDQNLYYRATNGSGTQAWSKVWTDTNDGSGSGLDADTLDGNHASAFAAASHTHNYAGSDSPGGPATSAVELTVSDLRSTALTPGYFGQGVNAAFMSNSTDGLSDGGTYHGILQIQQWTDGSGGGSHQLGFTDNNNIWHRGSSGALTSWGSWAKIWDSSNLTNLNQLTNGPGYTSNTGTVTSVAAGSYLTGGTITTSGTLAVDATSTNIANKVVARDANGDFSARIIQATDFNSTSDVRYKTDIVTIDSALNKVLSLRGVSFKWKDSRTPSIGVIAQELEQVIPEAVHEFGDKKTVSYGSLVGLLIEAIKEQQQQIQDLQQQLAKL